MEPPFRVRLHENYHLGRFNHRTIYEVTSTSVGGKSFMLKNDDGKDEWVLSAYFVVVEDEHPTKKGKDLKR